MALSAELEALVTLIQDPEQREARRKELTELQENGLRQADYSRKMNEVTKQETEIKAKHTKNLEWFNKADAEYKASQVELREAQEKIAALESAQEAGTGSDVADAELAKQLKEARAEAATAKAEAGKLGATVKGINEMIEQGKLVTADKLDQIITTRGNALGAALLEITDLQEQHRKDYGSDIDRKALLEEADRVGGDLKAAYKNVTSKQAEGKLRKDIQAQVEKDWAEKHKNDTVPYAEGGAPTLGPLQQRLAKKDSSIPEDVVADGSGRLANLVAAEMRAEGKV